jgi:hypothetical protein
MRMFEVLGVIGMGLVLGIVACGGSSPDSTADAQGAATNVPSGSATGTAASASTPPPAAPKSSAPAPTGAGTTPGGTQANPTTTPPPNGGNGLPVPNLPDGLPGMPGLPGDVGNGNDCCFNGKYFKCPNPTACFGGFDLQGCIQKCGTDLDCIGGCTDQVDGTAAPQGCDANAAPPPGLDCTFAP